MSDGELNPEVTDNRKFNLNFIFPLFRFKCISTTIAQKDLITIYRQVNSEKIKGQIRRFIIEIDKYADYETDIDGQKIKRVELLSKADREVIHYEDKIDSRRI